ncbi:MAG: hypothetical protein ACFE91_16945 [Promethearchaeota archaeon]
MKPSTEDFKKLKDPEKINDLLIKFSENPDVEHLKYLNYFIDIPNTQLINKIKLNLVYLIGEIGLKLPLDHKYLNYLLESYYTSDRWVRNEIIQAFGKVSTKIDMTDDIIRLIGYAINDDYDPIKFNALKIIYEFEILPRMILRNIFQALNYKDRGNEDLYANIFHKFLPDFHQLFDSLNNQENFKLLKSKSIRFLLLTYFQSSITIESFRKMILDSNWEEHFKELYLKEIDVYEKILIQKM